MEKTRLKELIKEFTESLETTLTQEHCLCEWTEVETGLGRRMVRDTTMGGTLNDECPVHTREGLILTFVTEVLAKHRAPGEVFTVTRMDPLTVTTAAPATDA